MVSAIDGFNDSDASYFVEASGGTLHQVESVDADFRWDSIRSGYEMLGRGDIIFCGPVEATPYILTEAEKNFNVYNASVDSVSKVRDISFLKSVAVDGVLFPETEYDGSGSWLVKSIHGAGGTSVREYGGDELYSGEYIQKFVEGKGIGATFVTSNGATSLLGITGQISGMECFGQPRFWYGGLLYPAEGGDALRTRMEKFGSRVGNESGLAGVWGADFILDGEKRLWLLEVNPRFTSSLELIANRHDLDIAKIQIEALSGIVRPLSLPEPSMVSGTAVCYAGSDIRFALETDPVERGLRDIPRAGAFIKRGEPLLSVYAEGESHDDCLRSLKKKGEPFRTMGADGIE